MMCMQEHWMLFRGLPVRMGIATGLSEGRQVPSSVGITFAHAAGCCKMPLVQ